MNGDQLVRAVTSGSESLSTPTSGQHNGSPMNYSENHANGSEDSAVSDGEENGIDKNGMRSKKPRSTHACQACRRMKIRCEPLEDRDSCKQCSKVNRTCLVTEPRRKRQKTVHRVSELEKKIDALTASLNAKNAANTKSWMPPSYKDPESTARTENNLQMNAGLRADYAEARGLGNDGQRQFRDEQKPYIDVVDRGIIDEAAAYQSFQRWNKDMSIHFPLVVFPPEITPQEVRSTRPYLFLAIITGAVTTIRPDLHSALIDELTFIFADRIQYRGERSFELVQCLLVLMLNYSRPRHMTELNFNQIIHTAATMALDIGLGRRTKGGVFNEQSPIPGVGVAEIRRTWLGIYMMCANASMSLRHPIWIRWSPYIEESLEFLTTSPEAAKTDRWLCELIKLQHIGEEVSFIFSMDDPAFVVSLSDAKTQYHIKTFESQLKRWHDTCKTDLSTPWIRFLEANTNLYIHEIAIHFDHNVDDFRPPPLMTDNYPSSSQELITPAQIDSLMICIDSIHQCLDAFFEMDTDSIRNLPNMFLVRSAYAAVALIKMDSVFKSRGTKFENVFSPNLKIESYLDTMIDVLAKASEDQKSIIAFGFGFVFRRLKQWYTNRVGPLEEACPTLMGRPSETARRPLPDLEAASWKMLNPQMLSSESAAAANSQPTNGQPANDQPITDENAQLFASIDLGIENSFMPPTLNDSTMASLGLPQFYDFGFTFDDMGIPGEPAPQQVWYPFSMGQM